MEKIDQDFVNNAHVLLDTFHRSAAKGDAKTYLAAFWHNAQFIGTDKTEVWTLDEFSNLVNKHFRDGKGWEYTPHNRVLTYDTKCHYVWFYEELKSDKYCDARGSGVLRVEGRRWVILQYVMSFAVPNSLVESLTEQVQALEV